MFPCIQQKDSILYNYYTLQVLSLLGTNLPINYKRSHEVQVKRPHFKWLIKSVGQLAIVHSMPTCNNNAVTTPQIALWHLNCDLH